MQREQVLATVVSAAALLSFGLAADGLRTEPPPVGREFDAPADSGYESPDLGFTWNTPDCAVCGDAVPLLNRAARSLPPTALVGLAVLAVGAIGGALVLRDSSDEDDGPVPGDGGDGRSDVAPASRPDRPGPGPLDADPDDAVTAAWLAMAERVDGAAGRALTPREYAARARRVGLDADAVGTLTDLFRRVRYGDRPVTDERERAAHRARDALDGTDGDRRDERGSGGERNDESGDPRPDAAGGERT